MVLLIEDDARIREALARVLGDHGFAVRSATTDVVVLDLGLPDADGGEILRMIRAVSAVPIIVATARDEEAGMVSLLKAGADDFVVKPFSGELMSARIQAVLRRSTTSAEPDVLVVGGLQIDTDAREAILDGEPLDLSRREFDLLAYLAARPGKVVTKRELLAEVWQQPYGGADKTVDVHLSWLRRKLGETATAPRYLRTSRGVGVRLVDPGPDDAGG